MGHGSCDGADPSKETRYGKGSNEGNHEGIIRNAALEFVARPRPYHTYIYQTLPFKAAVRIFSARILFARHLVMHGRLAFEDFATHTKF